MKKNIAMRVAAFLFILTMISTCAFATTFAKYTTSKEATDTARVAKWGVVISLETPTYDEYEFNTTTQDGQISSEGTVKLLAPGSTVSFANINLAGTPEVAVNVSYTAVLTLTGWTFDNPDTTAVETDEYCPLVFEVGDAEYYIGKNVSASTITSVNALGTIDDIAELKTAVEAAIAAYSQDFDANQNLADTTAVKNIPVTCSWDFNLNDVDGDYQSDIKDTALGNAANGTTPSVSLKITCTVTQED